MKKAERQSPSITNHKNKDSNLFGENEGIVREFLERRAQAGGADLQQQTVVEMASINRQNPRGFRKAIAGALRKPDFNHRTSPLGWITTISVGEISHDQKEKDQKGNSTTDVDQWSANIRFVRG